MMSMIFAEKLHLLEYTMPTIVVSPNVSFKIDSRNSRIKKYLRSKINDCINSYNFPKDSACQIKLNKSNHKWNTPQIIKEIQLNSEYRKIKNRKELVIQSFKINVKCDLEYYSKVIDEVILSLFISITEEYPIFLITDGIFPNDIPSAGLDINFAIIYPSSLEKDTSHLPPYISNFSWPDYNELFQKAADELIDECKVIGKTTATCPYCNRVLSEFPTNTFICPHCYSPIFSEFNPFSKVNVLVTKDEKMLLHYLERDLKARTKRMKKDWTTIQKKYNETEKCKWRPDCWRLDYYNGKIYEPKYYIRGTDEEMDGLKYVLEGNNYENFIEIPYGQGHKEYLQIAADDAEITNDEAQFEKGLGFEQYDKDGKNASYWYEKSAKQGNWKAMYALALLYYYGELVEKKYDIALEWFTKAADEDDEGWADFFLGEMHANGYGVERDLKVAKYWYSRAADKGHDNAFNAIKKLGIEYDDTRYVQKKDHEREVKQADDEKFKLAIKEEKKEEEEEYELKLQTEYPKLLAYLNAEAYSQPDYEIDLSASYTSKPADGKPAIETIINEMFQKCCNEVGLFNDDGSRSIGNCFLCVDSDSYFSTPKLLKKIALTKEYAKVKAEENLVIRTFDLDIELDIFDPDDLTKAQEAITLFLKKMNKDYPCFIERYSKYYYSWFVESIDDNNRMFVVIGIVYPADYECKPEIIPLENQPIERYDKDELIASIMGRSINN